MNNKLPALAFGSRTARRDDCPNDMGDQLRKVFKGLKTYDAVDKSATFLSQSSTLNINGLKLAANASTPIQYKANNVNHDVVMLIPFAGEGSTNVDSRNVHYRTGKTAAFLSNKVVEGKSTTRSLLMINVDANRLAQTARNMAGASPDMPCNLELNFSCEINLHFGSVSFDVIFREYANIINQFDVMPEALNRMRLDDAIYSAIVMMLQPAIYLGAPSQLGSIKYDKRLLDQTCQFIQANLTQPISLIMLDQISGMSRRKLHYAFLDCYRCTPMQWVRAERLTLVQNQLSHAQPQATVSGLAYSCGFTKMSTFAQYYRYRFGELPSATLSRSIPS